MKRNQVAKAATAQVEAKLKVKKVSKADIGLLQFFELINKASVAIHLLYQARSSFSSDRAQNSHSLTFCNIPINSFTLLPVID